MMKVPLAACFSVSRRPMCWTSGSSTFRLGSVTLTCSPSARIGSTRPLSAASSAAQAPAALTTRWARTSPADVRTTKPGSTPVTSTPVADDGAALDRAEREGRPGEERVRVALGRAVRRAEQVGGEVRREAPELVALEHVRLEPGLGLDRLLVVEQLQLLRRLRHHQAAGAVDAEVGAELVLERVPEPRRLEQLPHLLEQPVVRAGGVALGELVDRDLEVEAAGVRARGLAVQLRALEQQHVDPLAREVVGERRAGEPAADDQHVGLGRKRPTGLLRPEQVAQSTTKSPWSSIESSAIAASAVGRAGERGVESGSVGDRHAVPRRGERRDLPLAVPPLAEPHRGAREGLDDVDVRRARRSPGRAPRGGSPRSGR